MLENQKVCDPADRCAWRDLLCLPRQKFNLKLNLVDHPGFEPGLSVCDTDVLPLTQMAQNLVEAGTCCPSRPKTPPTKRATSVVMGYGRILVLPSQKARGLSRYRVPPSMPRDERPWW